MKKKKPLQQVWLVVVCLGKHNSSDYNNQRQCVPSYSISDIVAFDSLVLKNSCLENSEVLHYVDCLENHLDRILILISTSIGSTLSSTSIIVRSSSASIA